MTSPHWHLTLRRRGTAHASSGEVWPLGSKVAGLLAYLAVEGPTARSTLAGLLWPGVTEATARNNLRQVLGRHRTLLSWGGPLVQLSDQVDTDLGQDSDLLLDHDFGGSPEFMEWLVACRERFRQAQLAGCRDEVLDCEQRGELGAALTLNTRLLSLDDLSEEAHRRQMRLHYLLGDRASALSAYHHCQAVLRRELGVAPLPETAQLASEIERATVPTRLPTRLPLPLSLQRPPTLIGRGREWAAMQAAWDAGQHLLLSGEPGVGKTRLMRDFVNSHGGDALHFEARPGELSVPYSSQAHTIARLLEADLALPRWVRPELARLLPALGEAQPITDETQRLRFYQAMTEVVRAYVGRASKGRGPLMVAFDDLQFADPASLDAGQYILAQLAPAQPQSYHAIYCARRGALPPKLQAYLELMTASGRVVQIEVPPLDEGEVGALVESLKVTGVDGQTRRLHHATGGNPLYVLETVRAWLEQARSGENGPALSMPGGRTQPIIMQRLARLSPEALKLAQAAAVAQASFGPELAGQMLARDPLDLGAAWSELEQGVILQGNRFAHDLIGEAVLAGLPDALAGLLHRRAAAGLAQQGGAPARIAAHWLAAGAEAQALPYLVSATEAAEAALQFEQAHGHAVQAAQLAGRQGEQPLAFSILRRAHELLLTFGVPAQVKALLGDLKRLAVTPMQRAQVWHDRSGWHCQQGEGDAAVRSAQAGLRELALLGDQGEAQPWIVTLTTDLARAHAVQGHGGAAAELVNQDRLTPSAWEQREDAAQIFPSQGTSDSLPGHLTDAQWSGVQPLVLTPAAPGRPRADDRRVLEGVLWKLATGRAWRELPPGAASFATCHRRQQEWVRTGVLPSVLLALASDLDRQDAAWLTLQAPTSSPVQTLRLLCAPAALGLWQGGAPELATRLTALDRQMGAAQ